MPAPPPIDLQHLERLTDDTGLFQHAVYALPDPNHGYCIDDNARGLLLCIRYLRRFPGHALAARLARRYLTFVAYAYHAEAGVFRNFMSYDRRWLEDRGSQDSQGRAIWVLGQTVRDSRLPDVQNLAGDLFRQALPGIESLGYIRSWAFALLGLNAYLDYEPGYGPAVQLRARFAAALHRAYRGHATADWPWWEDVVTYDNAKLSQAMFETGQALHDPGMCEDATAALRWLIEQQTAPRADGSSHLSIIGNAGWLARGGVRSRFDQQPLEAWALAEACVSQARSAGDDKAGKAWAEHAAWCGRWFEGDNDMARPVVDPLTGGCRDGLQPGGPNRNQGAESTLSYLLTGLCLLEVNAL